MMVNARSWISPSLYLTLGLSLLMCVLTACSQWSFPLFKLDRELVSQGEYWRLFSSHFVHFGWPHTLMNVTALLICGAALLNHFSLISYVSLLSVCHLAVGIGIYWLNPEYQVYAGLSGTLHGLIVAGLLLNKRHSVWINLLALGLIAAKIAQENSPNYQASELQRWLPVAVAYDAHWYGALAGACWGISVLLRNVLQSRKKKRASKD